MSADEVKVTIIFLLPDKEGVYRAEEYSDIVINTNVSFERLKRAIIEAFPEVSIQDPEGVEMLVQASDGTPKTGTTVKEGDRILIMPIPVGPIVRRPPSIK